MQHKCPSVASCSTCSFVCFFKHVGRGVNRKWVLECLFSVPLAKQLYWILYLIKERGLLVSLPCHICCANISLHFANDSHFQSDRRMAAVLYAVHLFPSQLSGVCPQSPFTAIRWGPSGFNIFHLPVYAAAFYSSAEALLRAGRRVQHHPYLFLVGACQWTTRIVMVHPYSDVQWEERTIKLIWLHTPICSSCLCESST